MTQIDASIARVRHDWKTLWGSRPEQNFTSDEIARLNAMTRDLEDLTEQKRQKAQLDDMDRDIRGAGSRAIVPDDNDAFGTGAAWKDRGETTAPTGLAAQVLKAGFDLRSRPSVTVPLKAITLTDTAGTGFGASLRLGDVQPFGRDQRFLYPYLRTVGLSPENISIDDYRQSGDRTVTGTVTRDPMATGDKATLALELEHVLEKVKQVAVVIEDVPSQLFASLPSLDGFLNQEASYQLATAIDTHVLAQIVAATPPHGLVGGATPMFDEILTGAAAMRLLGEDPDLVVLNPTQWVTLRTTRTADGIYILGNPGDGSADTIWNLRVVDHTTTAGNEAPYLLDSSRIGVLYMGAMTMLADPFSKLKQNLVDIRFELNMLFHVRDANAAYRVAAT